MNNTPDTLSRRAFLRLCLAAPAPFILAACSGRPAAEPTAAPVAQLIPSATVAPPTAAATASAVPTQVVQPTQASTTAAALPATPACGDDDDEPTLAQTEGPYYTPNSPERSSLIEPDMAGTRIILSGFVLTTSCQPVSRALVDIWHADDAGVYDNVGYRLRGHQFTDDQGRYSFETIVPGLYPGRTRHFHIKVQAPDQPVLTTQLYFPNEPENASDGIFRPELIMDVQDAAEGKTGQFNFVLDLA